MLSLGLLVENELAKNSRKKKGRRKSPEAVLQRLLHPGSKQAYAPLGAKAQVVKVKPGETPTEALLREMGHG